MSVDVDYGDTGDLITRPLRYCKNPDLRYDLKDVSLYALPADVASIIGYLGDTHGCTFVAWPLVDGHWARRTLSTDEARELVTTGRYLRVYASPGPLQIQDSDVGTAKEEAAFWKRQEVIRINAPFDMQFDRQHGWLHGLSFANEYVQGDDVVPKPAHFTATTHALLQWLGQHFVSWRGKACFDNAAEHVRLFGERFQRRP